MAFKLILLKSDGEATMGSIFRYDNLLPTDRDCGNTDDLNKLTINRNHCVTESNDFFTFYHLYLIDTEANTAASDWFHNKHDNKIGQYGDQCPPQSPYVNKVIASTDKTLRTGGNTRRRENGISTPLPLLSEQSIKLIVDYYNENSELPDEVDIMTEVKYGKIITDISETRSTYEIIKLNSRGEVDIIIPEERVYSLSEILSNIESFSKRLCDYDKDEYYDTEIGVFNNFKERLKEHIKENLK